MLKILAVPLSIHSHNNNLINRNNQLRAREPKPNQTKPNIHTKNTHKNVFLFDSNWMIANEMGKRNYLIARVCGFWSKHFRSGPKTKLQNWIKLIWIKSNSSSKLINRLADEPWIQCAILKPITNFVLLKPKKNITKNLYLSYQSTFIASKMQHVSWFLLFVYVYVSFLSFPSFFCLIFFSVVCCFVTSSRIRLMFEPCLNRTVHLTHVYV